MLLFIEGYKYSLNCKVRGEQKVRDVLSGIVTFHDLEQDYTPQYVGYCYSHKAKDVVFFLPKVVLTGETDEENRADTVFGASPEEIIDFDADELKNRFKEEGNGYKEFLSNLAIWIYRTITVYKKCHGDNILEPKDLKTESAGRKCRHNTLLDVIIALMDFNRDNQDYLTFIARNMHSGYNKIQWAKTIARSQAIVQDGKPLYLNPVNKKKVVNFDEELLVIYFSILNYIYEEHGFSVSINLNYELISPKRLKSVYIEKKLGVRRLRQIKYKYFSDQALRIWDLCYAFFDRNYNIAINQNHQDFLLARDFDHVFEVMIDTLVSGDDKQQLNNKLINQKDGKIVDHMFIGQGLIEQSANAKELTYYIGDSKYYKRGEDRKVHLGDGSIYKQYTYARNVVQWNMNLFLGLERGDNDGQPQLFDELTEGYNPIPNFFISAHIPPKGDVGKFLSFNDGTLNTQEDNILLNRQFENRLFDRDTLLLCHYDVNFLFVVSLYGRDNKRKQATWREYIRREFRSRIQQTLNALYDFHILQPKIGKACSRYIREHFHQLNGKIYRPHTDCNYLILALMKKNSEVVEKLFGKKLQQEIACNEEILEGLKTHFEVSRPFQLMENLTVEPAENAGTLEDAKLDGNTVVLVGCVKNQKHWEWIKEEEKYNIRTASPNSNRSGALPPTRQMMLAEKVLLYSIEDIAGLSAPILLDMGDPDLVPTTYDFSEMKMTNYPFEDESSARNSRYTVYEIGTQPLDVSINKHKLMSFVTTKQMEYDEPKLQQPGTPVFTTIQELIDRRIIS